MVLFCFLQFDSYQLRPAICNAYNTTYTYDIVTIIRMIIAVIRFFTMSSVASSYLDTRYSRERERERNICIKRCVWVSNDGTNKFCERRKDARTSVEKI
jgi:hypothetical protein